jgi:hypothetical protein
MRNSMIIYRSFFDAIKELPIDQQSIVWSAILDYGLDQIEPKLSGIPNTIFNLIRPQLDANLRRYENGTKPKQKSRAEQTISKAKRMISKMEANDNDNVNDNVNVNTLDTPKTKQKSAVVFVPPTIAEMKSFFVVNGYTPEAAERCWHYYNDGSWKDSTGKPIMSWKQKVRGVWFKPENKIQHLANGYQRNSTYNPAGK